MKSSSKMPLCRKSTWPSSCQSATRVLASFWRVIRLRIHSEKYGSFSTGDRKRVASTAPQHDTQASGRAFLATLLLCACSENFRQKYLMGANEITRLLHGSMLTCHLRATQVQPSKCVETDVANLRNCRFGERACRSKAHSRSAEVRTKTSSRLLSR